jgi:small subunit ribosomal protein S6
MDVGKHLYETVFILHPDLSEEEVEANIQSIVGLLENEGSEILRLERGGKRRLAYLVQKQRYGYYNLIHMRALPEALTALERMYRLSERVIRYLTIRFDKEEQLTGFTRLAEDDGRDDDREERRRGGRRSESFRFRGEDHEVRTNTERRVAATSETTDPEAEDDDSEEATEKVVEETG